MPSIVDMVDILERLESKALHIEPSRCVKVRNRNASCTRCADACPSGAIAVVNNIIDIDKERCIGCGSCAAACPTAAILSDKPSDAQLAADIAAAVANSGGEAIVVCGRVAARREADANLTAEVLCLGRVDASTLVKAAAGGASSISLIDGVCRTCKYRAANPLVDEAVRDANGLLEAWGSEVRVCRASEVPLHARVEDAGQAAGGVSRRGFFTGVRSQAKTFAAEAATVTIEKELGIKRGPSSLREALKVGEDGCLPHGPIPRHESLLEDLFAMGEPREGVRIESRQWGDVVMDEQLCDTCGVCATFCPTGALSKVLKEPERKPGRPKPRMREVESLEFRLSDCVGCGLCADVCIGRALSISHEFEANRVFELEPKAMKGGKERKKPGGPWRR